MILRFLPALLMAMPVADDPVVEPIAPLVQKPSSEMAAVVERFEADRSAVGRRYPIASSPSRRERLRAFANAWRDRLREAEFDGLSTEGKVDYLLLDNELKADLGRLDREERQAKEEAALLPFADAIIALTEARQRLDPVDPEAAAEVVSRIKVQVAEARKGVEGKKDGEAISKPLAYRTARSVEELRQSLGRWFHHYDGYDPLFSWWMKDPYPKADEALKDYATFLRETLAGVKGKDDDPIIGDPIGREGLLEDLRAEMIPYSPEELLAIADKEFAWCEAEMKKASNEMGFGDDWKKALEKVKTLHKKPGEQPQLVRDLADEAVAFLEKNELVTIPPLAKLDWPLDMMSPERQRVNPFFLGGDRIIVSYPTDAMSIDDKRMSLRANNIHFSRATVFHELIPGHHLQYFMNGRFNRHRRLFDTPFWTEGWALYWEMLLWDKGFPRTPEDRVGMLFWRMHRCARIVFSLKFHLGQMTPQEAIDYLVDRVGHERFSATGEVRRSFIGGYSPLYQAAYMLGGLQIRALREELVESGKMTDRQFHDRILKGGPMAIEMVRVLLTSPEVTRDFAPSWRFAGKE